MTLRNRLKSAFSTALHVSGGRHLLQRLHRARLGGRRVLFVGYHRVVESFSEAVEHSIPGLLISTQTLRRQLEVAHRVGFQFATIDEALDTLSGKVEPKRDLLVVTFDDAYEDVFHHGLPVLRAMGIPAIMYVATEFVGTQRRFDHDRLFHLLRLFCAGDLRKMKWLSSRGIQWAPQGNVSISAWLDSLIAEYASLELSTLISELEELCENRSEIQPKSGAIMTWSHLTEWTRAGMFIGAHTVSHCVLPMMNPADQTFQISESKRVLESRLGIGVAHFAYCNGWYSHSVIQKLKDAGFRSAITTEDRSNYPRQDPFRIGRKILWENFSVGADGQFSEPLTACHLDHVFSLFGLRRALEGVHSGRRINSDPSR